MEIMKPKPEMFLLPEGTRDVTYAEHQQHLGYTPLPSLQTRDGKVVSQWKPDAGELELLKNGVPITLCVWTFGRPLQPVCIAVGGMDLR